MLQKYKSYFFLRKQKQGIFYIIAEKKVIAMSKKI